MIGLQEHRGAGEHHAARLQTLTELDEDVIEETLVAGLVHQPVEYTRPEGGPGPGLDRGQQAPRE